MTLRRLLAVVAALAAAGGSARAAPASYAADLAHAAAFVELDHAGLSTVLGRMPVKSGTVQIDRAARSGRAEFVLDAAALATGVAALDAQLAGKDALAAAEFPNVTFVGDRFVFNGNQLAEVTGQLTLRGKTQAASLKAIRFNCYTSPLFLREVCGGDFETTIHPAAFGIAGVAGGGDTLRVLIQVEVVKQDAP